MIGRRQAVQLKAASVADAVTQDFVFTVDRGSHEIRRIKFFIEGTNALVTFTDEQVRIQAEGELLYSGRASYVKGLASPQDHGTATNIGGPYTLVFDQPLLLTKSYPITVSLTNNSGGTLTYVVAIEGVALAGVEA